MGKIAQYLKSWPSPNIRNIFSSTSFHFFGIGIAFLFMVVGSSYLLGKSIEHTHIDVVKEELQSIAGIAAFNIEGDQVEHIQKPEDEGTEPYRSLQKMLIRIMKNNPKIDDVYLMRKGIDPRKLLFIVNAYPVKAGSDHVALGETYDISQAPQMLEGFTKPSVDRDITTDKWGQMLSGYAPVKNSKGKVIAILGIDYTANDIRKAASNRNRYVWYYIVLGLIVVMTLNALAIKKIVERLNNIKNAIDMLLQEKLDVSIDDTGHDEIKALALNVNKLIKKIGSDREQIFYHSTICLVKALEAKDPYTHGHSSQVAAITNDILNELKLSSGRKFIINFAAVLHDIGKIGISDVLLHKPGKLTDEEFSIIKRHPVIGEKILEGIPSLNEIRDIVRHHHERYDGKGYPDRLSGNQIHYGARIIAVADSFQAMISDRPYRKGMSEEVALQEILRNRDTQFDPEIVDVFMRICEKKKYKSVKTEELK